MHTRNHHTAPRALRPLPTELYFELVRKELADKGEAVIRVTGDSMRPLLRHLQDSVTIRPAKRIRPGDVVLFDRKNGRYALHRVIRTGKKGFSMMGDNQWHMEHDLPYVQVVGVVSAVYRKGRWIAAASWENKFFAAAAILLAYPRMYGCRVLRKLKSGFRCFSRAEKS